MAAGLNIERKNMEPFFQAIDGELAAMPQDTWERVRWVDGRLTESDLTELFFDNLLQMEPHGDKFPPFVWEVTGTVSKARILDRPGSPKVGTLAVGGRNFPFAMWENAEQVEIGQERNFIGCWEYNDYQRAMQFRAIGLA